jgi:drug/metabolite transporter (DMT)-like permease
MFFGGALVALLLTVALHRGGQIGGLPAWAPGWVAASLVLGALFLAANLCLQYGATRLPANTTAVVAVSEVLFASLSAVLLGAAALEPRVVVGGLAIVAAGLLAAWRAPRR